MEGILFIISPVWWNTPITWLSIAIALFWWVFIGISLIYKQSKKNIKPKPENKIPNPKIQLVSTSDIHYAEKTLKKIREYLTSNYYPMHSWAHIPIDIRSYTIDDELIAIIEQLEKMEFSGKIPEPAIIEQIQQSLLRKLSS